MVSIYDSRASGGKTLYRQVHLSWREDPHRNRISGSGLDMSSASARCEQNEEYIYMTSCYNVSQFS